MKIYIKNMVCDRCKMMVKLELAKHKLHPLLVELGEIELEENNIDLVKTELSNGLQALGFELMDDKKSKLIDKIKTLIIDLVHHKNNALSLNLSHYLTQHIPQDYNTLSNLFSEVEGTTIEKYFIAQKIEKVKELLLYDELTLSQIADLLHYSSVAHLSNQFKKVTGFSPSYYKKLKEKKRQQIDTL
ncbi:helix-turn-helix domain-containing protein [Flavobacterium agrisoli]|uniref:Helix-turn-helix transcriptional regulator n=1 Tax=Flavobacterium agrisoli TaxID=2793066 RepID=A0A934PNA9_9FLAO|nr:AraC family transcriptional regulator [Flavobacterium agrisoli]MBK0369949.1 helix-turn-helix transcriptional regulator [Flavobacterium agrisoli]